MNHRDINDALNLKYSTASLKDGTVKGGISTVGAQAVKFVSQTAATAVLARILMPEDFGLIAMVLAVSNLAILFKDLGLSAAVIQKNYLTHKQLNAVFWINVFTGFLLTLLTVILAPLIATFYSESKVSMIASVIGLSFLLESFAVSHVALMKRQLRFYEVAKIEVASTILSVVVAIFAAYYGAGYWSLVVQILTQSMAGTLLAWRYSHWRPTKPVMEPEVKELISFGGSWMSFNIINYGTRNLDNVMIGSVLGASALGIYSKAYNLLMMPIRQITGPLSSAALPALSKLQNDSQQFRDFYIKTCTLVCMISIPIVMYAYADADVLVLILLGEQWSQVVSVFRWLAPASIATAVAFAPGLLNVALGRPNVQLRWALLTSPFIILGFGFGLRWNVDGVAVSFSVIYPIAIAVLVVMSCYNSPVKATDLLQIIKAPLIASIVATFFLMKIKQMWPIDIWLVFKPLWHLIIYVIVFVLISALFESGRSDLKKISSFIMKRL